jgi:hypothetical protein
MMGKDSTKYSAQIEKNLAGYSVLSQLKLDRKNTCPCINYMNPLSTNRGRDVTNLEEYILIHRSQ